AGGPRGGRGGGARGGVVPAPAGRAPRPAAAAAPALTRAQVVARYGHLSPHTWGFDAPGVLRVLPAAGRVIALTFDACGGRRGSGYDQDLIEFLRRHEIPAPLFLNARWIDA